ncbi:MAG: TonB-dependent receptor [Candidatus Omnitrophota bacterium]
MKKFLLIGIMIMLCLPAALVAQAVTTGAFAGKVVDIDGKTVMGAEIVIVHVPTGTRYATITRVDGSFSVAAVRVGGPYTITAGFQGFRTEKKGDLFVKLGETKYVSFIMQLATVEAGEVIVTASDEVINPYHSGTSQNVVQSAIANLPTISRSLSDFVRLSPQMVGNDETEGAFSAGGRSTRYNNIQIDGAQNNDLFGLGSSGTPGGQAETTPISLETVQEFQLVLTPYDVRQGMFTGGGVNIVTKSGTNEFHGSAYFEGRNQNFVGKGPDDVKYRKFSEGLYGASLGGPIVKNKLFFFVSGEIFKQSTPEDYYIDGSGASYDFGHKAEADRFISILNGYGYDAGGYGQVVNDKTSKKLFARFDWNLSDKHRLTVRNNYVDANKDSLYRDNMRTFNFGNAGVIYKSKSNSTVLQVDSAFGQNLSNQLILNYTLIRDKPTYMGAAFPRIVVNLGGGISFNAGSEEYRHRNILNQDLIEFTDNLTLYSKGHTFIFGTHNEFFKFYNVYVQRSFGKYEFSSLDNLEAGKPSRYDRYYSLTDDPNAPAEFWVYQLGLFAGDEWTVSKNFTLTYGVRADLPLMPGKPLANPKVFEKFGIHTDQNAGGHMLLSPRIGFNVYPNDKKNTQFRGGIGVFTGRTPYVWISNQYSNTGMDLGRNYITSNVPFFNTDPYDQPVSSTPTVYSGDINLIDQNYRFPQVLKSNLAIDQKLPFGFTGTLEFVYSRNLKEIAYQNINLQQIGTTALLGGRPLYGTPSASGSSPYGAPSWKNKEFLNVILLTNTNKGYQYTVSGQLQKEWKDGSMINMSYTYGVAKDINSGSSSRAVSNWQYNLISGDPNSPALAYSDYDTRHRIMFVFSKIVNIIPNAPTIFSVVYNGRSGHPYSTRYSNDVNGDGVQNDLIYIPANADDQILTRGTWEQLNAYIEADPGLRKYRGQILPRNASRDKWYNELDIKVAQGIPVPFLRGNKLEISLTVNNILNMLNKDWGVYRYLSFDDTPLTYAGIDSATGKAKIEFWGKTLSTDARYTINQLLSRWRMLLGIHYKF